MSWSSDPGAFVADLEAKPAALCALADTMPADPWPVDPGGIGRVVLVGMGSSRFASLPIAGRLRARGIYAVAEYASVDDAVGIGGPGTLAVGISASGGTHETVARLGAYAATGAATIALTNVADAALGAAAGHEVQLLAGVEAGGVACRTFQHTLLRLLQLEAQLTGERSGAVADLARRAADAVQDLLSRREGWLPSATEVLTRTGSTYCIAPAARICTAEQAALMFREGPRLRADACETGDWLHVDVFLTKPLDYRAVVFTGSRFDADVMRWMRDRDARVACVGANHEAASTTIRYPGDGDPDLALVTEVVVAELVAAERWRTG